jgi:hypothetical protein
MVHCPRAKSSTKVQLLKCAVFWLAGCWLAAGWLLPAADPVFRPEISVRYRFQIGTL